MTVIGITGPTGSGKTTALAALERRGFEVVDCDALYYRLLQTSAALRRDLEAAFGPVCLPDGSLDRRTLAARVFGDPEELERLNGVVYPAVYAAVEQKIRNSTRKGVAIDAINLVESGIGRLCQVTVAVTADPAVRLARIMARDGLDRRRAQARIDAQKPAQRGGEPGSVPGADGSLFRHGFIIFEWRNMEHGREGLEGKGAAGEEERL